MRYFNCSKFVSFGVLSLICIIALPMIVIEHARAENFEDSVRNAQRHADDPTAPPPGWLTTNLVKIPDSGGTFGLQYDTGGNLIVRTATYSSYFTSNYVGQINYAIHGAPATDAAFVTTGNDFTRFYDAKGVGLTNTPLINFVERSVGINNDSKYVHNAIVEYSVNPTDNYIMRPTKNPDIRTVNTTQYGNPDTFQFQQPSDMSNAVFNAFKTYYAATQKTAYVIPSPSNRDFPWTQLGYTYYWGTAAATLSDIQGCTEFILPGGTPVSIYGIYATVSYIYTKNKGGVLSNAAGAQYGNGFASFDITDACDTVWAGHMFQNNVRRSSSNPNEIIIELLGTVKGGQGILVWSLNYNVTNKGVIGGPTTAKFGITGTDNIAILFEGDTSTGKGTPITNGINRLTNSGFISSAGANSVAVEVVNGNTEINNTGTIYSEGATPNTYAIWLQAGTNTVTNSSNIGTLNGTNYSDVGMLIDSGATTINNNAGGTIYGHAYAISLTNGTHTINNSGNIGKIPAPGVGTSDTGIRIGGGNTTITNNAGGFIYGDTYAILLAGGTNTVNNYANITSPGQAIQIDAGTTAVTNIGAGAITGNVTVANDPAAALDIGNGALLITAGNYTQGANGTLMMTANSPTDFGTLTATNIFNAASKMNVTVGGYIPNNTVFTNVINGIGVSVPGTIASSSPVFTFAGNLTTATNVSLTATRANSYNSFASSSNAGAVGSVLNTLAINDSAAGDMRTVLGALDSLTSAAQINGALTALTPNTDNSVPQAGYETQTQFINTILSHFDNIPSVQTANDAGAAVLGNDVRKAGIWAQGFDTYLHQDPRGLSNGYNANVCGTSIGYDVPVLGDFICGFNGGYAWNNIRTKDSSARTTADNYEGSFYGSYSHDACYVDSVLSFAYNQYNTTRHIALGGLDRIPASSYGGQQYSAYVESGYTFKNKKVTLTPLGSAQYAHLHVNGYTETGGGAVDLKVNPQDSDMFQTGIGARLAYKMNGRDYTLIPDIHVKWLYDFIGDNQQATSTFTGGGASFATNGFNPAQSSYDIGTRWILLSKRNITLTLNYDFELKEDFYSHSGYFNTRYDF